MIKAPMKLGINVIYLNNIKSIHDKPIGNIIVNGEKLKNFYLKSGTQRFSLSPLLFSIVSEFLDKTMRQEEEIKRT
jgi:hypothetical protein